MHRFLICALACAAIVAACSKKPADTANKTVANTASPAAAAAAPAVNAPAPAAAVSAVGTVSGAYTANGKAAVLTQVTAHPDDPFDGKPVTALVFSAQDQAGDPKAAINALFGHFGDAIIVKVGPDGSVVGVDVVHSGLKTPGSVSIIGVMTIKNFQSAGGVISGELTSGGPTDIFGDSLNVDLTFRAKAP